MTAPIGPSILKATGGDCPALRDLNNFVAPHVGAKWFNLGLKLFHRNRRLLHKLKTDHHCKDSNDACTETHWPTSDHKASWKKIITALRSPPVNLHQDIAADIKLQQSVVSRATSKISQRQMRTTKVQQAIDEDTVATLCGLNVSDADSSRMPAETYRKHRYLESKAAQLVGGRLCELAEQIGQSVSQKSFKDAWLKVMYSLSSKTENQMWKISSIRESAQFLIHLGYSNDQGLKLAGKFAELLNAHIFSWASGWDISCNEGSDSTRMIQLYNNQRTRAEKAQLEVSQLKRTVERMKLQVASDQEEMKLQLKNALTKMKTEANTQARKKLRVEEESRNAELELLKLNEQLASKLAKSQKAVSDMKVKLQRSELKNKTQREHLASREVYWETVCEELRRHNKNLMSYIEIFSKVINKTPGAKNTFQKIWSEKDDVLCVPVQATH